ncbi:hypothetical protein ONZ51_g2319 [Trametes cubensis]|uniref:F-box domain-containing protein n=1 Tax=Trametes cubensis TaxID=1111947 RepID=A0AAD7XC55_9APHY|nr:hypothetical protein ONZ51_g2319 [Trametes cubensis]
MKRRKGTRKSQATRPKAQARNKRSDEAKSPLRPRIGFHSLPIEILDTVFKHAPKTTLLTSSRVSRLWRDFALPHLFASIRVARETSYDDFFDFLHARPKFVRYIRSLKLISTSLYFGPHPTIDPPFLHMLVEKLPRLQELSLEQIGINLSASPSTDTPVQDMAGPPRTRRPDGAFKLKQLSINRCIFNGSRSYYDGCDLYTLFTVLHMLPTNSIHVIGMWVGMPDSFDRNHPRIRCLSPLDISSLSLEDSHLSFTNYTPIQAHLERDALFCDALRQMLTPQQLHTLRLGIELVDRSKTRVDALGKLLRHAVNRDLRDFALPFKIQYPIDAQEEDAGADFWRLLRLECFPELETFGISLNLPSPGMQPAHGGVPRAHFSAVCIAIMSHLPRTLRILELTLWGVKELSQLKNTWAIDPGRIDDALQEYFPSLAKFRVVFRSRYYLLEFATFFWKAMPKSKARGILEVTDTLFSPYK